MWGFLQLTVVSLRWSPKTICLIHCIPIWVDIYIYIYDWKSWGKPKWYINSLVPWWVPPGNRIYMFLFHQESFNGRLYDHWLWKKAMLNYLIEKRKEKPDVLSVGLPAANYSFFAAIPENNISYIAFQHEQEQTHTHTHIYIYIYIQVKTLGRTKIIYQFASFMGSASRKSNICIYKYICMFLVQ